MYQFLQLSAHSALWRSKSGAAFAASTVFRHARADVEPHLPRLLPRLYRFAHDPNAAVASSMKRVLAALCGDDNVTASVKKHSGAILIDLHKSSTAREWRVRESACTALADLLPDCEYDDTMRDLLEDLWKTLLKVADDIKEV